MATREPAILSDSYYSLPLSSKGNTEGGLTKAQSESLARVERDAGNLDREVLTVVGTKGEIVRQYQGNEFGVVVPDEDEPLMKDAVITHNHPGYFHTSLFGDTLASQVGLGLAKEDVAGAISLNAKEIRAVTKGGYVYSLKRPSGGWGADPNEVLEEMGRRIRALEREYMYKEPGRNTFSNAEELANRVDTADSGRQKVIARHRALQELSDKYGWRYTRRKWKT